MTGKIWWLVIVAIVILPVLAACNSDIEYGMTEAEAAQMAELGYVNADNVTNASRIAGYPVAVPDYIPEGFSGGAFSVSQLGAGLPEVIGAEVKAVNVSQGYCWQEDETVCFYLMQVNLGLSLGDSEPAEFCDHSGQRYYREAEGDTPPLVTLGWEVDGMSFYLSGLLTDPIDEATLEQIACSIEVDK